MEVITESAAETKELGRVLAAELKAGSTLALTGDLGSGKTTFVQGLAKGLGFKGRIISPTFILMRRYPGFYHVDLYRFEGNVAREVENIGLTDIWGKDENIVVIEWAEKIKNLMPTNTRWVRFKDLGKDKRRIIIE